MKKISLLITLILTTSVFADIKSKKITRNTFDELTITLPYVQTDKGNKFFFNADYTTAETVCHIFGKKSHYEYSTKNKRGVRLFSHKVITDAGYDGIQASTKSKRSVIAEVTCSGINLNDANSSRSISPAEESRIKQELFYRYNIRL